jgi:hypothetical protein
VIRILPSSNKNSKKNLGFCSFVTSLNVPSKSKKQKTLKIKKFFVGVLKVTDEKSRIH